MRFAVRHLAADMQGWRRVLRRRALLEHRPRQGGAGDLPRIEPWGFNGGWVGFHGDFFGDFMVFKWI